MNKIKSRQDSRVQWSATTLVKMSLVTALYVAITLFLAVISFGVVQIRLSEMFNYLAIYNKRYILAVTLGVMLANLFSPLGLIDVVVGGLSTFIVLVIVHYVTKKIQHPIWKFIVTGLICSFSMFTIAGQLALLFDAPFWATWLAIAIGELVSMSVGGVIMYLVSQKP